MTVPNPERSLAERMASATDPEQPPSLFDALARMGERYADLQGDLVWGARWPAIKEAQRAVAEHQRAEAVHQAKLDRLATLARRVVVVYLLAALVLMATAGAVWAWRVAL